MWYFHSLHTIDLLHLSIFVKLTTTLVMLVRHSQPSFCFGFDLIISGFHELWMVAVTGGSLFSLLKKCHVYIRPLNYRIQQRVYDKEFQETK